MTARSSFASRSLVLLSFAPRKIAPERSRPERSRPDSFLPERSASWKDVAEAMRDSTSARVISADVISGDARSTCCIMPWAAPGMADARPNIPIALIQIDARIIMSSTLVCPVPTGCYPDGKWPNSLSPSGISKRDYVYDHVLATVAGQALEPVSRARADYVFACMKTNGKRGGRWRGVHAPSTSSRRSCRYVAAGLHEVRREERERDRHVDLSSGILSIGQRGGRCSERCPPGLSSGRSSQPDKGINPRTYLWAIRCRDRSSGGEPKWLNRTT